MDNIPEDIIGKIVPLMSYHSILNLCQINKFWKTIGDNSEFRLSKINIIQILTV